MNIQQSFKHVHAFKYLDQTIFVQLIKYGGLILWQLVLISLVKHLLPYISFDLVQLRIVKRVYKLHIAKYQGYLVPSIHLGFIRTTLLYVVFLNFSFLSVPWTFDLQHWAVYQSSFFSLHVYVEKQKRGRNNDVLNIPTTFAQLHSFIYFPYSFPANYDLKHVSSFLNLYTCFPGVSVAIDKQSARNEKHKLNGVTTRWWQRKSV